MIAASRPKRRRSALSELQREEAILWRLLQAHKEAHGCGAVRVDCDIKDALTSAWITLYDGTQLPSPDPRVYGRQP